MESGRVLRNSQIIILGICIAFATITASVILARASLRIMQFTREVITVTGSAQHEIRSDFATWEISFGRRGTELTAAYRDLQGDLDRVKSYLRSKGVAESETTVSQAFTTTLNRKNAEGYDTNEIEGYRVSRTVTIESADVDKLTELSREATELINEGIAVGSSSPQYFYTKLDELKVEMLARATANAKQRAESMARSAGNRIGLLRSARMGVFQITPLNSTEISDYGVNDTSSLEKKVTAVVSATFAIE
jgi:uncharacterized protein